MEIINIEKCMAGFQNKFSGKTDTTVTVIANMLWETNNTTANANNFVHVVLDHSSLVKLQLAGAEKLYFRVDTNTLYGQMIDFDKESLMDLNPIILSQQENSPGSKFFKNLRDTNNNFEYYLANDSDETVFDLTINNLACSHFHPFTEIEGMPDLNKIIKAGNVAKLVGLMRRKVSNSAFINGFVDFRNGERPFVSINVPVMGGPLDKKYGKLKVDLATMFTIFANLAKPTFIIYNGLTHTFMCREVVLKDGNKFPDSYPLVKIMGNDTVNPSFKFDESLSLECKVDYNFASDNGVSEEINYDFPILTPKKSPALPKEKAKPVAAKQQPAEPVVKPTAKKKSQVVRSDNPEEFLNVLKTIIFNHNIPEDHALSIMRNLSW